MLATFEFLKTFFTLYIIVLNKDWNDYHNIKLFRAFVSLIRCYIINLLLIEDLIKWIHYISLASKSLKLHLKTCCSSHMKHLQCQINQFEDFFSSAIAFRKKLNWRKQFFSVFFSQLHHRDSRWNNGSTMLMSTMLMSTIFLVK